MRCSLVAILLFAGLSDSARAAGETEMHVSFKRQIAPLLVRKCFACHGVDKTKGGYRLASYDQLLRAGDSKAAKRALKLLHRRSAKFAARADYVGKRLHAHGA